MFLYIIEIMKGQKRGLISYLLIPLLFFISMFWKLAISLKNWGYSLNVFKQKKMKPYVVSIGNITAGGTGKTPLTIFLANQLTDPFAVIARGYKSNVKSDVVLANESSVFQEIGDELLIIKKRFPFSTVLASKDRKKAIEYVEKNNIPIVILDDAMQYRKIKKDLEIVVLNNKDPWGRGHFLPYGFLREPKKSLQRADLIVVNHVDKDIYSLKKEIRKYSKTNIVCFKHVMKSFKDINKNKRELKSKKIAAFCAIANPECFFSSLKELGFEIVLSLKLLDHEPIDNKKLSVFVDKAKKQGANYIVCTEKDIVKIDKVFQDVVYLEIDLEIVEGQDYWKNMVEKISKNVNKEGG